MRVLYVGNGNYKFAGARYYDPGRKIVNGLIRLGHNVYFFSDRDAARKTGVFGLSRFGPHRTNELFLRCCKNFKPDLILFCLADLVTSDALDQVRTLLPHVKMAQFNVDPVFRPHNRAMITQKLPWMDATFVTTAGPVLKRFHREEAKVAFVPNAVDASIEWPCAHRHTDQMFDIFWALRAPRGSYPGDPRIEYPRYLKRSGKVTIDYHGMDGVPELFNAAYYEAIANARMGLNISVDRTDGASPRASEEELYLYSSDRIAHYMGSGLLTFATRDNALEEMFTEDAEMVFFTTPEELLDKVLHYRAHDTARQSIAQAGWEKYHRCFNERLVAKFMVEVTFGLPLSEPYAWPTDVY